MPPRTPGCPSPPCQCEQMAPSGEPTSSGSSGRRGVQPAPYFGLPGIITCSTQCRAQPPWHRGHSSKGHLASPDPMTSLPGWTDFCINIHSASQPGLVNIPRRQSRVLPTGMGVASMQLGGTWLWTWWTCPWLQGSCPRQSPGDHGHTVGWGARRPSLPHPPGLQACTALPFSRCLSRAHHPICTGAAGEGLRPLPALCPLGCLAWQASHCSEEQTQPILGPRASGSCPAPLHSHQLAGPCPFQPVPAG